MLENLVDGSNGIKLNDYFYINFWGCINIPYTMRPFSPSIKSFVESLLYWSLARHFASGVTGIPLEVLYCYHTILDFNSI
jgi:hypothetical protein